jgi:hypothetical protein
MGQFRCDRCEETSDSKGGDAIEDPNNNYEMIHESCLTDKEIDKAEHQLLWEAQHNDFKR